jgi:2',3'-cyclic-nucleotide 2'-phosphodiesterase (5'-nucleotidase family)
VDSGNLLFKQAQIPAGPSQELLTADGIIKAYTAMHVDAVAVGPLDLAAGIGLLQTSQQQGFPWLSANLLDQHDQPLFQLVRIKKIGKIKAGIIGLTGAVSHLPAGITRADWRTVLPALIKKTTHQCDLLILLSTLSPAENQEIARQFPALHLIFTADLGNGNMNPQQVNNTLITQTDRQGKYQGILTVDWQKSGRWGKAKEEELTELRNRLGALNCQIERMQQRTDLQQPEYIQKIALVEKDRKIVEQQIKALEHPQLLDAQSGEKPPCTFKSDVLALQQSLPESPEIKVIVTELKQQINNLQQHKTSPKSPLP